MRSILVQTGRDAGMTARLDTAMAIARFTGGHLTLLVDTPIHHFVSVDPYGGNYVAREALDAALAADDRLAAAFEDRLQTDDVPFDVVHYETEPLAALGDAARLSDLVILPREGALCGDLAIETRVPILVLPSEAELTLPLTLAAIAWDGSDQAAAALRAAVPLLKDCPSVSVLTVTSAQPGDFPATEALRYLSRHGISAELVEVGRRGTTEESLAAEVDRLGAQVLVMGAFSRHRMTEFLFGGVTRYFLNDANPVPLLIAH